MAVRVCNMTQKSQKSRQLSMNLTVGIPKTKNIATVAQKDITVAIPDLYILTIEEDDYSETSRAIKNWILDISQSIEGFFNRKANKIKIDNVSFMDGIRYMTAYQLVELSAGGSKELEDQILSDLSPLLASFCQDCKNEIEEPL